MTIASYIAFVASRAKPGQAILDSLTPGKCELLHMAIGMVGEANEVMQAESELKVAEELGDVEFYFTGLMLAAPSCTVPLAPGKVTNLRVLTAEILEAVKKYVIYGRDLHTTPFYQLAMDMEATLISFAQSLKTSRDEIREANQIKLTARYPSTYSDAAALARADKNQTKED